MSRACTKVNMLAEAINASATPATPTLQVQRHLLDVAFPESLPYNGLVSVVPAKYICALVVSARAIPRRTKRTLVPPVCRRPPLTCAYLSMVSNEKMSNGGT